ncbi:hypothetical protein B0H11DRAFT_1905826 [Mycena galericulata]|nr:hypothetical protein B0H11DRAFT_1905826 [Mycena galericulata]
MTRSSRTHRLRSGTVVYAAGFVATVDQMESMARNVCDAEFLKRHGGDCVYALKWHVRRYEYEILDNDRPGTHFFAIDFFPWLGADLKKAPALSDEQRDFWHQPFGRHATAESYEERTVPYPTNGGAPQFLEGRLQDVIAAHDLWHLLEPIALRSREDLRSESRKYAASLSHYAALVRRAEADAQLRVHAAEHGTQPIRTATPTLVRVRGEQHAKLRVWLCSAHDGIEAGLVERCLGAGQTIRCIIMYFGRVQQDFGFERRASKDKKCIPAVLRKDKGPILNPVAHDGILNPVPHDGGFSLLVTTVVIAFCAGSLSFGVRFLYSDLNPVVASIEETAERYPEAVHCPDRLANHGGCSVAVQTL